MQHGLSTRLGLMTAAVVLAAGAWAADVKPWAEGDDYVRLENVNASNQHPVNFSPEQLGNLLSHFYKKEPGKDPAPYFTKDEIERLSAQLVPAFSKAKGTDDIEFGTSYRLGNFFLTPRVLNAGRLFVDNGQLNLIVGMCGEQQDLSYQQAYDKHRPLNHGTRIRPAGNLSCELIAGNDAVRVDNRPDWLRLNVSAALANGAVAPQQGGTGLTFGAGTTPAAPATHTAAPQQGPVSLPPPAASQPMSSPSQAVLPAAPASKTEERLQLIKRLHDNGLITDAEYEQKRASILKDL